MTIIRNIAAVVVGFLVGMVINGSIVNFGPLVIPNPEGYDVSNLDTIKATFHLLQPINLIVPFAAHAFGTLTGSLAAFLIAGSRKSVFAYVIGIVTLAGGITASILIPAPMWFIALDLIFAYIPMTWIAILVGGTLSSDLNSEQ